MSNDLAEMPDALRAGLPADLEDAEIAGTDVAAVDENVRLHGPPGTGKSTQMAFRAGTLSLAADVDPADMTVVTYRKSLANTIRTRLASWGAVEVPEGVDPTSPSNTNPFRYWTTIHGAAARATGFFDDVDDDEDLAGMVTGSSKWAFCDEHDIGSPWPSEPWEETRWTVFKDLYDYAKNNLLDVGTWAHVDDATLTDPRSDPGFETRLDAFRDEWGSRVDVAEVVDMWESFKAENDVHDFHEMLESALVGPLPPTKLVMIDEFHDATPLMAAVAERWVDAADTAIVAGDPDQVVNAYAGADPRFFEELGDRVDAEIPTVMLERSWRCPDEHFEMASRVLRGHRDPPDIQTDGPGSMTRQTHSEMRYEDGEWVLPDADEDRAPVDMVDRHAPDLMFLARTQKQADGIAACLDRSGIIYSSQDDVGGDWELRLDLCNALAVLEDMRPMDDSTRKTHIGDYADDDAEGKVPEHWDLPASTLETLLEHSHGRTLSTDESEWRGWLDTFDDDELVTLDRLATHVKSTWWDRYGQGKGSVGSLTGLDDRDTAAMRGAWERQDHFAIDTDADGVRILTIHASKGSEAEDVVVYDGITSKIRRGVENRPTTAENEARTWYVALTRASARIHIVRDTVDHIDPWLPDDLCPLAAQAARDAAAATDGGEPDE